jgi:hypothetical protein
LVLYYGQKLKLSIAKKEYKMYTVNVETECGCFRKSSYENNMQFESKDDALIEAKRMEDGMNEAFCQKHLFTLVEDGNTFQISVGARPKAAHSGGCCGGGHCS